MAEESMRAFIVTLIFLSVNVSAKIVTVNIPLSFHNARF